MANDQRMKRTGTAAKAWGVDNATYRRWARSGKVPAVKTPGGHWRTPTEALPASKKTR
jgi:excisionase family DNA binding protein